MDDSQANRLPELALTKARAFTLVELMIVVVLIGLLAGIGGFYMSGSMEDNRIAQMNRDIANGFLQARSYAMRTGNAVVVDIDDGDDWSISFEVDDPDHPGQSCALADDPGTSDSAVINSVGAADYGLDIELAAIDPSSPSHYCVGPNGRVVGDHGQQLGVDDYGCTDSGPEQMNMVLLFQNPDLADEIESGDADLDSLSGGCDQDVDSTVQANRDLVNFSMVHVGYGGQVRVIR